MKLFTKTYVNDLEWLKLAIKTVGKFCKEEVVWTIVIEDPDLPQLSDMAIDSYLNGSKGDGQLIKFHFHGINNLWPEASQIESGYLRQQWVKLNAHKVMGNGFFLNWDSDVIAVRPFSFENFKGRSGRPIQWFGDYNHMIVTAGNPADVTAYKLRRDLAGKIFEWPISFEWMRCMPAPLFGEILSHGSTTHYWNRMFEAIKSSPEAFSEFNFIGEFAHQFFPDAFEWRNVENSGPTWADSNVDWTGEIPKYRDDAIVIQGWSWGGIPDSLRKWVDAQ